MANYSFRPRWQELVGSGKKRQTIRPIPKRMPKIGDKIRCFAWTGRPYHSKQRVLATGTISDVRYILIGDDWIMADKQLLSIGERCRVAENDGFASWREMQTWFEKMHGLPFEGILIRW